MSPRTNPAERVAIVLPNKLGDAILSLPLILCLRKLAATYGSPDTVIEVFTYSSLKKVFDAVGVTGVMQMNLAARLKSWLQPPHKAFFLVASSKNFGFRSRCSYGRYQQNKWLVRYDHELECIGGEALPHHLDQFLTTECRLPRYSVQQFGVVLKLGYSIEQVIATFTFSRLSLPVNQSQLVDRQTVAAPYLVFCMEVAGGKGRRNDHRRWAIEHYFALAKHIRERHGYRIVFIGITANPPIPEGEGLLDLRGTLSLWQLFTLMTDAVGYVGNDTGPLHMANLMGIPTVGIYSSDDFHAPLFGELNTVVMRPTSPDDAYPAIQKMIENRSR